MRLTRALRHRPPISVRLALWSTLAVFAAMVLVGIAMTIGLRSGLRDRAHETLEVPFRVVEHHLATHPEAGLTELLDVTLPGAEVRNEVIGQILDPHGAVIDATGQPATLQPIVDKPILAAAIREGEWHEPRRLAGRDADDIVVVVPVLDGPRTGDFVVLAQTLKTSETEVGRTVRRFLVFSPLVLLVSFIGGWWIARAALRPVDALTRQAATIDPEFTDTELPVPPGDDEVTRLANALNDMLARLRTEIERERRFSADASHELRSPLALMRAELDVTLRSSSTPTSAVPIFSSLRDDVERLGRIVDDLLVLSRAEAVGRVDLATADIDLLELAVTAASRFRPASSGRDVEIGVSGVPAIVRADAHLLGQAVANLIDNAVKFSKPGDAVAVNVAGGELVHTLTVTDHGPGIASDALAHIFERFYQVDTARTTAGSGLGLAIVDSIVRAHRGTITVESSVGSGSTFTIELPASPSVSTKG